MHLFQEVQPSSMHKTDHYRSCDLFVLLLEMPGQQTSDSESSKQQETVVNSQERASVSITPTHVHPSGVPTHVAAERTPTLWSEVLFPETEHGC